MLTNGIRFTKVWSDEDLVELRIEVSDGTSFFSNLVYVGHADLADTVSRLDAFTHHIHGGLLDVRFGEFGPEYASGAFHARFHFPKPGKLYVTSQQESDFQQFSLKTVASCATLYIKSEPALLERFVEELKALSAGSGEHAFLEGGGAWPSDSNG
jgi:hypothetical protein